MTTLVPAWLVVLTSLFVGFALHRLAWTLLRWMVREGPWSEQSCLLCLRSHDSEARRLQRQLTQMHENYKRLWDVKTALEEQIELGKGLLTALLKVEGKE